MSVNMRSGVLLPIQTHATTLPHPEKKVLRVTMTKISHHWCPTATAEEILSSWHPISSTQLCKARVLIKLPRHAHGSPNWPTLFCSAKHRSGTTQLYRTPSKDFSSCVLLSYAHYPERVGFKDSTEKAFEAS